MISHITCPVPPPCVGIGSPLTSTMATGPSRGTSDRRCSRSALSIEQQDPRKCVCVCVCVCVCACVCVCVRTREHNMCACKQSNRIPLSQWCIRCETLLADCVHMLSACMIIIWHVYVSARIFHPLTPDTPWL